MDFALTMMDFVRNQKEEVSFQWKNPHFLFKNPDFLLTNVEYIIKQDAVCKGTSAPVATTPGAFSIDFSPFFTVFATVLRLF